MGLGGSEYAGAGLKSHQRICCLVYSDVGAFVPFSIFLVRGMVCAVVRAFAFC